MIYSRYADMFEICWPVFWPWLWLQLAVLCAQKEQDGRERLIMGTWWGKVYILAVGSDTRVLETTCHLRAQSRRFETHIAPLIAAKFPGDAPSRVERAGPAPCALQSDRIEPVRAEAFPETQDKTHILAPG
ncbi:MAG: hypothetical protein AAFR74_08455 [Pseudomonadota bacterium]